MTRKREILKQLRFYNYALGEDNSIVSDQIKFTQAKESN